MDLLRFLLPGGQKKLLVCGLLVGITTQTETIVVLVNFKYVNADWGKVFCF